MKTQPAYKTRNKEFSPVHRHRHFFPNFTLRLEENFEKLAILAENRTLEHPPMFWDMLKVVVSVILSELYIE